MGSDFVDTNLLNAKKPKYISQEKYDAFYDSEKSFAHLMRDEK